MTTQMLNLSGRLESAADLDVKGLVLKPGVYALHVNGQPARVRFTREVIQAAYAKLKAKLARGGGLEMRLVHPDLHPLSIPYGRATAFRHDPTTGSVYLASSVPLPEVESLFDEGARDALLKMGLSMRAPARLKPCEDGEADYDAAELGDLTAVDIVDEGAFAGSNIVQHLPAGLVARISSAHAKGAFTVTGQRAGTVAQATDQGEPPMPKLESVEQVPDEVRAMLQPEQLPAYITAYNAAIDAGMMPEDAHKAALAAIAGPAGQDETMTKELEQVQARLSAATAEKTRLEQEKTDLEAALAAAKGENTTLDQRLKLVEADLNAAKAEKADREAADDVEKVILSGRATPAMREGLLATRKASKEGFAKLAASLPQLVPVGEKGRAGDGAPAPDAAEKDRAERLYVQMRGEPDAIIGQGLHQNPAMRALLAARHPDHPKVKAMKAVA